MIPIFFPFTYLSQKNLNLFFEWFDQIVIYQPSILDVPSLYDKYLSGQLIIRTPLDSYININQLKQERLYLKTKGQEMGPKMSHIKGMPGHPPLFDELSVNRIRAEIKEKSVPTDHTDLKPLLTALYLHLVQDLEIQQEELNQTLAEVDQAEKELFQALKNENMDTDLTNNNQKNTGEYHRILKAWFYMYQYDPDRSNVLITNNKDVLMEIQEWNPDLSQILVLNKIQIQDQANIKSILSDHLCDTKAQMKMSNIPPTQTNSVKVYLKEGPLLGTFMHSNDNTSKETRIALFE